ncbi:MAG: hypothetical protein HY532_02615 [Chloroflexi bacterium]|nr:hypothetical protein [Chloroflexota bacterium]
MQTRITATELARNLSDILNRVRYKGERFVEVRKEEVVAVIEPVEPMKHSTLGDLIKFLKETPLPDPDFARDVEAGIAAQGKATFPEWPS